MTPFIVGGLVVGGIYAIATLGLVLTYRSSRVFNFAHGAIAYVLALAFHELAVEHGWNRVLAGGLTVFVLGPLLGLFLWAVLFRRLAEAPPTVRLVSTVGLWVALPAIARVVFGSEEIFDRTGVGPSPPRTYRLLGVVVDSNQLAVIVAALAVAVVVTVVLRATPFGLAVRATVDNQRIAAIRGINTGVVSAGSWMIGTGLAGLAGVLLAPLRGYLEFQFTFLVLAAFAAVVMARMTSLVIGFAGAMLIGIVQNVILSRQAEDVLTAIIPEDSVILKGLQPSIPFLLMLVFLLAYRGLGAEGVSPSTGAAQAGDIAPPRRRGPRRGLPFVVVLAGVLLAPELLSGLWEAVVAKGLALAIIFLSYTVVTGEGGMISLCQVTFAGIAGAVTAQLATNQGWPVLAAVLLAAVIVVPVGLLVALPSLRLGDLYLALATLAFAELVQNMYFQLPSVNNFDSGVVVPRPRMGPVNFADDRAFYYLLVGLFVLVALLVANLKRSTTGLTLAAMRSSETATATMGISIVRAKLVAFGLSAFIAGLGGGLFVTYAQRAQPAQAFNSLIGIVWLAVVVTWGVRSILGALLAGLAFAVLPQVFVQNLTGSWLEVPTMLFGLGAIGLAREPRGVVHQVVSHRRRRAHTAPPVEPPVAPTPTPAAALAAAPVTGSPALLEVHDLEVAYGEARAVFGVSLRLEEGRALAVLGANGAGKSSLAAAVAGALRPAGGRVLLDGADVTGWAPHRVARAGVAYVPEGRGIFPGMSVADNLRASLRHAAPPADREAAVERALTLFPVLAERRRQPAGTLSGGEQQMLSLARVLAAPPRLLIADEMSLGLAPLIVDLVFETLEQARREGVTVLLVEQYVERALAFADDAVLMRHGRVAWAGPAARAHDELVASYLGADG